MTALAPSTKSDHAVCHTSFTVYLLIAMTIGSTTLILCYITTAAKVIAVGCVVGIQFSGHHHFEAVVRRTVGSCSYKWFACHESGDQALVEGVSRRKLPEMLLSERGMVQCIGVKGFPTVQASEPGSKPKLLFAVNN